MVKLYWHFPSSFNDMLLDKMSGHEILLIHSAEDVKNVIEEETNMTNEIKVHTAAEIKAVRESLPNLGPLSKAMKIHEILIAADGDVKSNFLPSDVFYDNVKITESRRHRRVEVVEDDV